VSSDRAAINGQYTNILQLKDCA